jgi:hypothetical protein
MIVVDGRAASTPWTTYGTFRVRVEAGKTTHGATVCS